MLAEDSRNKHSVFVPNEANFNPEKIFDSGADLDHMFGNHFRAVRVPSYNQQNYAIN